MKLKSAIKKLEPLVNKKFKNIFSEYQMKNIIVNKGRSGQLLELALGLNNSSKKLDFEDGELKTNKCNSQGKPLETMYITQISRIIDDLIKEKNFYNSRLYQKINNLLYVPISKDGNPEDWFFLPFTHINLENDEFINLETEEFIYLKNQLEKDYYNICKMLKNHIENSEDGFIHTSNGEFIQIRSKDSKPYHPIYSDIYNREVSNKNHAFYFRRQFMMLINDYND
ncbi:MAG: MutH/Sau3AI family endonuclease [archaeon]